MARFDSKRSIRDCNVATSISKVSMRSSADNVLFDGFKDADIPCSADGSAARVTGGVPTETFIDVRLSSIEAKPAGGGDSKELFASSNFNPITCQEQ